MSKVLEFQKKLLTDESARKKFAADPKGFLKDQGVKLPAGLTLPAQLDAAVVNRQISAVAAGLKEEKIDIETLDTSDAHGVTTVIGDAMDVRTRDLAAARAVHTEIAGRGPDGRNATVAVVGAVVAAVVAVPVATFGRSADWVTRVNPAGIEKISRGQLGMTLHGPQGLRIEGISVDDAAALIRNLR
jgi:hypothetical protein